MGNLAARIQKQLNTRIEKIPDDRFGTVNAHDDRVWQEIMRRCPDFRDIKALYRELGWSTKKITPTKNNC